MKDNNYIAVFGWMVKLGLSGNDLFIFGMVYGFSQDGQSYFTGSLKYIMEWLNISKPTAMRSLDKLVEMGLIIKEGETRNNITFNRYKVCETVVTNYYRHKQNDMGGGNKMIPEGGNKMLPNNTSNINTSNKIKSPAEQSSLFPEQDKSKKTLFRNSLVADFEKFKKHFEGSEFKNIDIYHYFVSIRDWSESKTEKRTSKGWLATCLTWMRNDKIKGKLVMSAANKTQDQEDYMEYLKMGQ